MKPQGDGDCWTQWLNAIARRCPSLGRQQREYGGFSVSAGFVKGLKERERGAYDKWFNNLESNCTFSSGGRPDDNDSGKK